MPKLDLEYALGRRIRWDKKSNSAGDKAKFFYGRVIYACPTASPNGLVPPMIVDTTSNQPCFWWSYEEYERFLLSPRRAKLFRSSSPKLLIVKRLYRGVAEDTYPPTYYAPTTSGISVTHMELDKINRTGAPLIGYRPLLPALPSNIKNYPNVQYIEGKRKKYGRLGGKIKK